MVAADMMNYFLAMSSSYATCHLGRPEGLGQDSSIFFRPRTPLAAERHSRDPLLHILNTFVCHIQNLHKCGVASWDINIEILCMK